MLSCDPQKSEFTKKLNGEMYRARIPIGSGLLILNANSKIEENVRWVEVILKSKEKTFYGFICNIGNRDWRNLLLSFDRSDILYRFSVSTSDIKDSELRDHLWEIWREARSAISDIKFDSGFENAKDLHL
jgi:hypothetical protein